MCTAISLSSLDGVHFFGRNMDIEYDFGQNVVLVPRNFKLNNKVTQESWETKYAFLGMGPVMENHPLLADGFNEHGLACAGLNFPGYASYNDATVENSVNLAPYDLILWILGNFKTTKDVETQINNINLVEKPFLDGLMIPPLHWIVYDKFGDSIVIEKTKEKLNVFKNELGVLSNSPTFDWHLTNLNQYTGLSSTLPNATNWNGVSLAPQGQGLGLHGLPGDSYPASRFVRASYMCSHAKNITNKDDTLSTFYRILGNLAFVDGSVITNNGHIDITLYSSAMDLNNCIYYYNTSQNSQINAIDMMSEDLNTTELKVFEYKRLQNINKVNF